MRKFIILILAVLLSAGAYAADIGNMNGEKVAKLIARNTMRGYHGFVELGMGITHHNFSYIGNKPDTYADKNPNGFGIEILTSHGYQFSNFFFLGGGVGINECTKTNVMVPIFADLRVNILDKRISPVIDFKWGYAVGDHHGVYLSFNAGVRFGFNEQNSAIYALAEASCIGDTGNGLFHLENKSRLCGRFFLRMGYEF